MTTAQHPSYRRAPSQDLRQHLLPGGFLAPILDLDWCAYDDDSAPRIFWRPFRTSRGFASHDVQFRQSVDYYLDVHFRLNDGVQVYRGTTSLLKATLLGDSRIKMEAANRYTSQRFAHELFRTWSPNEGGFEKALRGYIDGMKQWEYDGRNEPISGTKSDRQKWISQWLAGEGNVQERWAQIGGYPWTPFDREAVLEKSDQSDFPDVEEARKEVSSLRSEYSWAEPPWEKEEKSRGELDQLAVDINGNLMLIEFKDANGGQPGPLYYSPMQLLQYIHEWHTAFSKRPQIMVELQELLNARKELFLCSRKKLGTMPIQVPDSTPRLSGGLRAAICFGHDGRSDEVKDRYKKVLTVANKFLPPEFPPIETWKLEDDRFPEHVYD